MELQQSQLSDYALRRRKALNLRQDRHGGSGEPTAERFWLGQYNEVLVDSEVLTLVRVVRGRSGQGL